MDIKYFGHSSFYIKSKDTKLVMDPFDPAMVGLKFPKVEANIVTISHHHRDHNNSSLVGGNPLIIDLPGEFEKMGIRIFGYQSYHDKKKGVERGENILYKIEAEGLSILHCGDLGLVPEDSFIDGIGDVDILMVPVGGTYCLSVEEAIQLAKKTEPAIILPMHYKLNNESIKELAPVDDLLKKMNIDKIAPIPKLTIKKESLEGEMRVVLMEINN